MKRLDGRVCLVTGSTGIAAAAAQRFAAEGAAVFVTSRTESHCRDLANRITAAGGPASVPSEATMRDAGRIIRR